MRTMTSSLALFLLTVQPAPASGQTGRPFQSGPIRALALANQCGEAVRPQHSFVARVSALRGVDGPPPSEVVDELEAEARDGAAASPQDADAQYALAAILGVRTDLAEGRARLALAEELLGQVRRVLEIEPSHPGAHHILGRLGAGVMRMSWLDRFLAQKLIGGDVLAEASWTSARHNLEVAEAGDPCIPDHHFELARLYLDRGEPSLAYREIGHVLELTSRAPARWGRVREEVVRMAERL
jgi:hypothetical protein